MTVKVNEDVGRDRVEFLLAPGVLIERLSKSGTAKVSEKKQTFLEVTRKNFRRRKAAAVQPVCDSNEGPWILVRGRRIHQDCGCSSVDHTEVATEGCIASERQDIGTAPSG
jgi:hypothetical protein